MVEGECCTGQRYDMLGMGFCTCVTKKYLFLGYPNDRYVNLHRVRKHQSTDPGSHSRPLRIMKIRHSITIGESQWYSANSGTCNPGALKMDDISGIRVA